MKDDNRNGEIQKQVRCVQSVLAYQWANLPPQVNLKYFSKNFCLVEVFTLFLEQQFLEWQPCHSPLMVLCLESQFLSNFIKKTNILPRINYLQI